MHQKWDLIQWAKVAFSDESTFTVRPTTQRKRVWRKEGERYRPVNFVPTFKSGYQSISVWATFSIYGRTPLIRIEGTLNQQKYIKILREQLLPFASTFHGGTNCFIFQQDGCDPHRAKSVRSYLDAEGIELPPWPAQIPDMNPIKNTWAILKRNLRQQSMYPTSKDCLFTRLSEVWDAIPSKYFEKLVASMNTRVTTLRTVKGLSTKN